MVVLKFGGSSVADVESIRRVAGIVAAERRPRLVVVSALAGVTDALLTLAAAGGTIPGNRPPRALDALLRRHVAAGEMLRDRSARASLDHALYAIAGHVAATLEGAPGTLSPGARDEVAAAGELWSSRLLAAVLRDRGADAVWLDARAVMRTNSQHGHAAPDLEETGAAAARLVRPQLDRGQVVVVGGFIGSDPNGATTTLGRGGSDWSAAVFGASLDAEEIQIWTDVDGVLTADPRVVPHARPVPYLSYGEAQDLASFGAEVLHPGTIAPAVQRGIPVVVRNSHRPHVPGTLVSARAEAVERPAVAGLACRGGATLLEAEACGSAADDGFVSGLFEELRAAGIEAVLADRFGDRLAFTVHDVADVESLRQAFASLCDVRVTGGLATVTIVGDGLPGHPQLPADAARALRDVPVLLVARPAGARALSFVVDAQHATDAMSRLHDYCFGVSRRPVAAARPAVQR